MVSLKKKFSFLSDGTIPLNHNSLSDFKIFALQREKLFYTSRSFQKSDFFLCPQLENIDNLDLSGKEE